MRVKMPLSLAVLFAVSALAPPVSAQQAAPGGGELQELRLQLEDVLQRVDTLEKRRSPEAATASQEPSAPDDDLSALRRAAAAEADKETPAEDQREETTFKSGNLGLQALNPEISVTGDMLEFIREGDDVETTSDVVFRGLGLHFEAYLDPYSRFKAAVPVNEGGAELGEAYFTRYGLLPGINVTLGKFRQQFGVVNRWHKHALDWFDFPLPLRMVFGPGGLNQTGLSLDWNGGIGGTVHELIVQATDGDNTIILGQNTKNRPSVLAHYKAYRDLSAGTYVEIGWTGFIGWNDAWRLTDATTISETLASLVYGIDLTIAWEPLDRMRYRNVEWRSEAYIVDQEIHAPDGSGRDRLHPWGLYTSLQSRMTRTIDVGLRFDYCRPETRPYATVPGLPLSQVVAMNNAYRQQSAAFLTWSQSPFVKFRVGYSYTSGRGTGADEHAVGLQIVFAAGPHKHERY